MRKNRILLISLTTLLVFLTNPANATSSTSQVAQSNDSLMLMQVFSAHTAKTLCSEIFIAGRDADAVLQLELHERGIAGLDQVQADVDYERQRVTASFGIPNTTYLAVFRQGLGCVVTTEARALELQTAPMPDRVVPLDPQTPWPMGESVDFDPSPELEAALDNAFLPDYGTRAVVVVHDGKIVAERYAEGFDATTAMPGWSMAKTVSAVLAGIFLNSQDTLTVESSRLFPAWQDERSSIRIADLLSMSDGLGFVGGTDELTDELIQLYLVDDMAAYALEKPLINTPGTTFNYSNGSVMLIMALMKQGFDRLESWINFPTNALFAPIGMSSAIFETDQTNTFVGSSSLYATARDWARLGLLLEQEGMWFGQQVIPAGWVDYMISPSEAISQGWYGRGYVWRGMSAWNDGYMLPEDDYWLSGFDGQYVTVIPSEDLVIIRLGFTPSEGRNLRAALANDVLSALSP